MKFIQSLYVVICCIIIGGVSAQGNTDIFEIARKGNVTEAKEIIKANPKAVNLVNVEGFSPLILASYRGNTEVAKYLIENGANINAKSSMGTPLMAAVVKGNLEIVNMLLDKKADANISDPNGMTALIYASMFKNYEATKLLIRSGANPDIKDSRGNSAIDYAILADDDKLIEILKSK